MHLILLWYNELEYKGMAIDCEPKTNKFAWKVVTLMFIYSKINVFQSFAQLMIFLVLKKGIKKIDLNFGPTQKT